MNDYNDIDHSNNIRAKSLKNIVTALALCHNVTPVYD